MTILQIIIYWLISEVLVWTVWYFVAKKTIIERLNTENGWKLSEEMSNYPRTQLRIVEWLRFIVWPYGIAQRTVLLMKMRKKIIDGN